jgi:exonuclease VII large subunit
MIDGKRIGALATMFLGAGLLAATPAEAGRIRVRAERQQARIAQGVRSGSLTAREIARIEAREAALARDVRILRRDGLSPRERARIERRQDRLSRDIYRQKHDRQRRPR